MTDDLALLADQLSEVLVRETELLDALDLPGACAMLPRKRDAVAALQVALQARSSRPAPDPDEIENLRQSVARMNAHGFANRAAIERGLALQMRVIQAIAQAVPKARATEAPIYQQDGNQLPPRPPEAWAFQSRM